MTARERATLNAFINDDNDALRTNPRLMNAVKILCKYIIKDEEVNWVEPEEVRDDTNKTGDPYIID